MIIQSSNLQSGACRTYRYSAYNYTSSQLLNRTTNVGNLTNSENPQKTDSIDADKNNGGQDFSDLVNRFQNPKGIRPVSVQERLQSLHQIRSQAINYLLQMLFGRRSTDSLESATDYTNLPEGNMASGYTFQTVRQTSYFHMEENETTSFSTQGTVVAADGRQIDINLQLSLSRSFVEDTSAFVDYTQPILCDPLVIQLNGALPSVSDEKFFFDLDCDGTEEEISKLGSNNGFLALDHNNDGIINDGSELFGVQSGNGFSDLAVYDIDKNGWIDEADEIFSKLKIWAKDESGNDKLLSLKEAGVGAICLDNRDTQFAFRNSDNITNAIARRTGIFLYENGSCGSLQQLDMAT